MFFKKKNKNECVINPSRLPNHIAFIMDGNGRWAKKRNMPRTYGHHEGTKTIRDIALVCNRLGVKVMTVYAFSTENFKRSQEEVNFIFSLPKEFFDAYIDELMENNVQIRYIGHLELAPKTTQEIILSAVERTQNNTGLILCFAFIYGSRDEIVLTCKNIAKDVQEGYLSLEEINESLFDSYLMSSDLPDVDLLIRTSGEMRLSNFMLWQISYAELMFTETMWPDFNEEILLSCIQEYQHRNRRFGGLNS